MAALNKEAAGDWHRATAQESTRPEHTKIGRILEALRSGRSLNRFEAETLGDHALNSTIARLRGEGVLIVDEWEEVPTRFGRPARVKRYRYAGRLS